MRSVRLAVLLVILAAANVAAGTPEDPEISDPAGDAALPHSATLASQDALDLTAVWMTEEADTFTIHWEVVELAPSGPLDRFSYALNFEGPDDTPRALVWRQRGDAVMGGGLWTGDTLCAHTSADDVAAATLNFDASTNQITLIVPLRCAQGGNTTSGPAFPALRGPFASTEQCGVFDMGNACRADWTNPDMAGPGRDFVFKNSTNSSGTSGASAAGSTKPSGGSAASTGGDSGDAGPVVGGNAEGGDGSQKSPGLTAAALVVAIGLASARRVRRNRLQ